MDFEPPAKEDVSQFDDDLEDAEDAREFLCYLVRECLDIVERACLRNRDERAWALFHESWVAPIFEGAPEPNNSRLREKYRIDSDQELQTLRTRVMRRFKAALRVRAAEYLNEDGIQGNSALQTVELLFHPRAKTLTATWRDSIRRLFAFNSPSLSPRCRNMAPLVTLLLESEKRRVNRALRASDSSDTKTEKEGKS